MFWVQQDLWDHPAPLAPKELQEHPDQRAKWVMSEFLDSKEKLESREREVTMELQVHWAQWERTESVDPVVMVDPSDHQDLQERQELQETEVSQVQMVYLDKREPRVKEDFQGRPVPKVYLEIQDVTESQV